ncbi:MAG TPA: class I SAM-dependent rRNA methyltransferase [Terracidiphilus sp.]|jgi:23S rRNA (cytosine1962-C5)-methyltransferase|nr:class I SAM-dependent rRNA methyltransferase [Terracidiphilus sp.]
MTKSRRPDSARNQKAPEAHKPKAPFVRPPKSAKANLSASSKTFQPQTSTTSPAPLGARITRRAADRLRSGHLWVYASDIESLSSGSGDPPNLLPVADNRGLLLGTALYSPSSQIALRLIAREAVDEPGWLALLESRLERSIERRIPQLKVEDAGIDSCRLCFSEADEIPGLIIDKYGPLIIVQRLTRGLVNDSVRDVCVRVLRESFKPETILERPDPRIRELEALAAADPAPWWSADPAAPITATQFHLNGLAFHFDANAGQKTGAFLDQAANYAVAQQYAGLVAPGGRALDVCTYQGGFALHLARVSQRVTGIDTSRSSLEVAERNLVANRSQITAQVDWVEGDAFQILRDWAGAREQFDTIVLDPPAFAKSKRAIEGALRGYKELNLRALQMLRPGGLLVTCSCSHHVTLTDLESAVASAAADAHRRVRLLQRRGAAPDHPVVLNLPETEYLKCLVLQVD